MPRKTHPTGGRQAPKRVIPKLQDLLRLKKNTSLRPLSAHALAELRDIESAPVPTCNVVNAGVSRRLYREGLLEIVQLKSPFKEHRGGTTSHLRITAAGRARLAKETK